MQTKRQVRKAVLNAVRRIGVQNVLKALQLNDDPLRRCELPELFGSKPSRTSQLKLLLFRTKTELTDEATQAVNEVLKENGERVMLNGETLKELGYEKPLILSLISGKRL